MSISAPRGNNRMRQVFVYDPDAGRKVYVGQRPTEKQARLLEAEKTLEFAQQRAPASEWTVDAFAQHFLDAYHGPNTTRLEATTRAQNDANLRDFRKTHGHRPLASVTRDEAHQVAKASPHRAKTIAAMFNEAVDKGHLAVNPFARLGLHSRPGRRDIDPLTEDEVGRLAEIARRTLGHYGDHFSRFVTFAAWTGMRPGELCGLDWPDVDLAKGEARVHWQRRNDGSRVPYTKTKRDRSIVLAAQAVAAVRPLPRTTGAVFASPTGKPLRPNALRYYWRQVRAVFTAELAADHWLTLRLLRDPADQLDPYELRHHAASVLADRGLNVRDVAAFLGNSPEVCEVYVHDFKARQQDRIRQALGQNVRDLQPQEEIRGKQVG